MSEVTRPDFSFQWSSGGSIVAPSNTKIQTGWTAEVPPFQWENWSQNRQDNAIVHLFQKGISVWSSTQDYYFTVSGTKAHVQGSDGIIYEAVQSSTGQDPTTDATNTYWKQAFRSQSGAQWYALDSGTANTYKAAYVPVVKTLVDGMVLKFKALNANSGASTFTPANGVITPAAIVGGAHSALQGGEIVATGDVWLQWNTSIGGGSWVLIDSTGGGLQVAAATKSQHAIQLGQAVGRLINVQKITATGTYTPTAGAVRAIVEAVGGGGAGGGVPATGAGNSGAGGGGASGTYGLLYIASGLTSVTATIGGGGAGVQSLAGGAGGSTSFGGLMSCPGGLGGSPGVASTAAAVSGTTGTQGAAATGSLVSIQGPGLGPGISLSAASALSGGGGSTRFGFGGTPVGVNTTAGTNGLAATGFGGGGSGATAVATGAGVTGGAGAAGIIIVYEYS